jgi:hypothetical protein
MSQPGQLYKHYIEMGGGDESTGSTTYNCYYKSMESCVGTNNLIFYSGYGVPTYVTGVLN